jgi:hypothetical protein
MNREGYQDLIEGVYEILLANPLVTDKQGRFKKAGNELFKVYLQQRTCKACNRPPKTLSNFCGDPCEHYYLSKRDKYAS